MRTAPSRASTFVMEAGLAVGRVLDYGYRPSPPAPGAFDTILCVNVLSAVSKTHRVDVLAGILAAMAPGGSVYFGLPRNLPPGGKLSGHSRRPQENVHLRHGKTVHEVSGDFAVHCLTREELAAEVDWAERHAGDGK